MVSARPDRLCSILACSPAAPNGAKYQSFNPPESDYYQADPVAFHLHQPHASRKMAWSEHPRGSIELRTNNLGFREDADTFPGPSPTGSYRILVTGDSHTDGVVYNDESFANRLELYLGLTSPTRSFEVINGGVGYYGPFQYRGFFARQESLEPEFLIVNVFLGNDFLDTSRQLEATTGIGRPRTPEYLSQLGQADAVMRGTVGQSLNQLYYFKSFPEMVEPALEATAGELIGLQQDADQRGIPLLVTLMPSQIETAPQDPAVRQHLELAAKILGLEQRHLELQERFRKELATPPRGRRGARHRPLPGLRRRSRASLLAGRRAPRRARPRKARRHPLPRARHRQPPTCPARWSTPPASASSATDSKAATSSRWTVPAP